MVAAKHVECPSLTKGAHEGDGSIARAPRRVQAKALPELTASDVGSIFNTEEETSAEEEIDLNGTFSDDCLSEEGTEDNDPYEAAKLLGLLDDTCTEDIAEFKSELPVGDTVDLFLTNQGQDLYTIQNAVSHLATATELRKAADQLQEKANKLRTRADESNEKAWQLLKSACGKKKRELREKASSVDAENPTGLTFVLAPTKTCAENTPKRKTIDGQTLFFCGWCGEKSGSWSGSIAHIRKTHTHEKDGPCTHCKKFSSFNPDSFRAHVKKCCPK